MGKIGVSKGYIESFTPIGSIIDYSGLILPPGWLWCDGSLLLVADYPELYAAIGDTFGSTTPGVDFNIPDFRGRTSIGRDDMGGVAANRITSATMNPDGITLGATGGLEKVSLITSNIPNHTHVFQNSYHTHNVNYANHYHYYVTNYSTHMHYVGTPWEGWMKLGNSVFGGSVSAKTGSGGSFKSTPKTNYQYHSHSFTSSGTGGHYHNSSYNNHNHINLIAEGSDTVTHLNIIPGIILNCIIKY
jgi:microcystin-dependent protein